ncbi:hypothetical protein ACFQ38_15320 [Sporosarcina contaminans]|uniref:Uncharacterized protein n=1 Tax=Sporosarcina contaminans TaxID=633403 RepID=A0ABW3U042_9BACL
MRVAGIHYAAIKHIDSIESKDIQSFLQTISDREDISVIIQMVAY